MTMLADRGLLDTNIRIYALDPTSDFYAASDALLERTKTAGAGLCMAERDQRRLRNAPVLLRPERGQATFRTLRYARATTWKPRSSLSPFLSSTVGIAERRNGSPADELVDPEGFTALPSMKSPVCDDRLELGHCHAGKPVLMRLPEFHASKLLATLRLQR
jgi:hypothetical protein